jgi:2-keto-3-deoxy-L-rhamnonate aldolase RhmA
MMKLMLITADDRMAVEAQAAGVDRIFLDLEYIHKSERQMGRNTFISHHTVEDVARIRKVLDTAELLVRVNPINPNLKSEIDRVIADGADIIMLPMVMDADDVRQFVAMAGGRARVCLLLETTQALARIEDILNVAGVDEVYIGLNDLHIGMKLTFMFELLSGGIVEYMAEKINARGIPFGFGGMAKIGEGMLPAEHILGEHYRLGSQRVILSRTFRNEVGNHAGLINLHAEIAKIRAQEKEAAVWTDDQFAENKRIVKACVGRVVEQMMNR